MWLLQSNIRHPDNNDWLSSIYCASVVNHIPRDDIFDYHPLRECNIYIILCIMGGLVALGEV